MLMRVDTHMHIIILLQCGDLIFRLVVLNSTRGVPDVKC